MKVDANDVAREIGTGALRDLLDAPAQPNGGGLSETARPPDFTDEALALRFAAEHAKHLRYVAAWSKWLIWDGKRWQPDDTLRAFDHAREVCREESAQCDEKKFARAIASAPTVAAVVTLARADRRLAATIDQWDLGAWLLNTPAGVIDLQTGKCRPHRPNDYFTKLTGVAPDASCPTPTWLKFLDRITASNAEVINFLRRVAGYSLTGITREQALFFLYGGGANGKSTFLDALIAAAGDYHRTAPIETFTVATGERHPTDLAGLRGAQLVTAVQTEEGRQWAESKIKALTGGDKIAARFMRQDFFGVRTPVQVADRRQPQAGPEIGRRGDPAPYLSCSVFHHNPAGGARQKSFPEAQSGTVGNSRLDDPRLSRLAAERSRPTNRGHCRD